MLVSPGVHLIELALPFTLGAINIYLVKLHEGFLLIDCGMDTPECMAALDAARRQIGFEWPAIRKIVLTHIHPDHMGLAPKLLSLTGAQLMMHPSDAELLVHLRADDSADQVMAAAGTPLDLAAEVRRSFTEVKKNFHLLHPDTLLYGGEEIQTADGKLEVIWTPGHSPGHLCLYDREKKILFSGDHILENISPNIGWMPEADSLGEYLDSLQLIGRLEVDLILPSHGQPFRGHREWIERVTAHHQERCQRILDLVRTRPRSAHQMVAELWDRPLAPFHYRFAVYEVLAHLEHMRQRGDLAETGGYFAPVNTLPAPAS